MCDDDIVRGPGPAVTLTHAVDEDSPLDAIMVRELLRHGHREVLKATWPMAEARIVPTWLDAMLPADARLLFRDTHLKWKSQEALLELDGCLVSIERRPAEVSVQVAAVGTAAAEATLARLRELLPEPPAQKGTRVGMVFWHVTGHGPRSDRRSLE
ncbi:MAG: DUF5925 domain-containing protein, partial [Actinobacteria bacterium]|nr:DUF5925 domain-containing protein [Actinomycetota bacterium]